MTATETLTEMNIDREISTSRVFDAPREAVFRAISDPTQLVLWWGPKGFTNTFQEFDFREGGNWRFVMHGPDGKEFKNHHTFAEITEPERVVLKHLSSPRFELIVSVEDEGGKTRVNWRQLFETAEECARIKTYAVDGNEQNLDRLGAHLAAMAVKPFIISRAFDAPRELIWKAWSERARLMEWFGPRGFKMPAAKMDFRPGGSFHYCVESPDGHEMWGKFVYREIVPQERIVLVNSFSDEDGGLTRHPMSASWPLETLSSFTLTEENGRSTASIRWLPFNATAEEIKTFDAARESMKQGWSGTFDQLAAYLVKAQQSRVE